MIPWSGDPFSKGSSATEAPSKKDSTFLGSASGTEGTVPAPVRTSGELSIKMGVVEDCFSPSHVFGKESGGATRSVCQPGVPTVES